MPSRLFVTSAFIALLLAMSCSVRPQSCPSPNEKCDCSSVTTSGFVLCTGLHAVPHNLTTATTSLDLDSNVIGPLLSRRKIANIDKLRLEQLFLSNTGLEAIESRCFEHQTSLTLLDLSNNNLRLNDLAFFGLSRLTTLIIKKSSLVKIPSSLFVYTPSLTYLDLSYNNLTTITNEFQSLTNLGTFLASFNKIVSVDENAFTNKEDLTLLELQGNRLCTPNKSWVEKLVRNNGTLKLNLPSNTDNHWKCCETQAADYAAFTQIVSHSYVSYDQLNIQCSGPDKFEGMNVASLSPRDVQQTSCKIKQSQEKLILPATIVETRNSAIKLGESIDGDSNIKTLDEDGKEDSKEQDSGTSLQVTEEEVKHDNFMSQLADWHIVLIMLSIALLASAATALIVYSYVLRRRREVFDNFLKKLPSSGGEDDTFDDFGISSRTYRQDVAVYGSTGNIIDRHRGLGRNGFETGSTSTTSSLSSVGTPEVFAASPRRKPPPYVPSNEFDGDLGADLPLNSTAIMIDNANTKNIPPIKITYDPATDQSEDEIWNSETIK